ncbi:hypothetical protein BD414DRAFT_482145 [Trametes punicea]|nr:hypothetical protein BD414DRAFT_482145 [Trametes punicea]
MVSVSTTRLDTAATTSERDAVSAPCTQLTIVGRMHCGSSRPHGVFGNLPRDNGRKDFSYRAAAAYQRGSTEESTQLYQGGSDSPRESTAGRRLPPELWLRIFGYAAAASPYSLVQAAAACYQLQLAAEEALYTFPDLFSIWVARRFASAISRFPQRAQMVRGLRLSCQNQQLEAHIEVMKAILPLLVNLRTLDLVNLGEEHLFRGLSHILSSLRRIRGLPIYASPRLLRLLCKRAPRLEELHFYAYTSVPDPDADHAEPDAAEASCPEILGVLPNLRALSCPQEMIDSLGFSDILTSLCITGATRSVMDRVSLLFGNQLVSLRVERRLGWYSGLAYPTNWYDWKKFPRLKFLDVQDKGKRKGDIDGQTIKIQNLPADLETLVWGAAWLMDCALVDSRSELWRREQIRTFVQTVLRCGPGLKAVFYRWAKGTTYQCVLTGDDQRLCEAKADHAFADENAWADGR